MTMKPVGGNSTATQPSDAQPTNTQAAAGKPAAGKAAAVKPTGAKLTITKPVAPPSRGSVHSRVASQTLQTRPAVPLAGKADFGGAVTARLLQVKPLSFKARLPGEISGPALSIAVRMTNGSSKPFDIANVTVTVTDAQNAPGVPVNGGTPLTGSLVPGAAATGTYVFTLAAGHRSPVTVSVTSSASPVVLLFHGNAA